MQPLVTWVSYRYPSSTNMQLYGQTETYNVIYYVLFLEDSFQRKVLSSKNKDLINYPPHIHEAHTDSQTNWCTNTQKTDTDGCKHRQGKKDRQIYTKHMSTWQQKTKWYINQHIQTINYKLGCLIFRHFFKMWNTKKKFRNWFPEEFLLRSLYKYKKIKTCLYSIHKYVTGCHEKPPDDHENVVFILICSLYCLNHELKNIFAVHQLRSACTFAFIFNLQLFLILVLWTIQAADWNEKYIFVNMITKKPLLTVKVWFFMTMSLRDEYQMCKFQTRRFCWSHL